MSTTRLPELPDAGLIYMGLTGNPEHAYSAAQLHTYGLAVWKAAIQHAVEVCAEHADKHRGCGSGTYSQGRLYAAEDIAHALASLPLPEQGGPQ